MSIGWIYVKISLKSISMEKWKNSTLFTPELYGQMDVKTDEGGE